jgi:RNase H-fold protein (predicted Holliday junction resolvase)
MTILGISIGTSRTGICILKDGVLLDRQIHNYTATWSDNKLRIITKRYKQYILKRNVSAIVVKIPPINKHTKAIKQILKKIEGLATEYYLEFDLVTKSEIKHTLHLRSTDEIIKYALQLYPEINYMHEKGKSKDDTYYNKLYEAVLAAHVYQQRQLVRAEQIAHSKE